MSYDAASRLTGQQYQDGTRATMTYDANSRRTVLTTGRDLHVGLRPRRPAQLRGQSGRNRDHVRLRCGRPACDDGSADRDLHLRVRPGRADQQPDQPRGPSDELVLRCGQPRNPASSWPTASRCRTPMTTRSAAGAGEPGLRRHDAVELRLHLQSGGQSNAGRRGRRLRRDVEL